MIEPSPIVEAKLTIVLPTRNRARYCSAQLHFFRQCGVGCPIVVADSSDPMEAQMVRKACAGLAQYRRFDASISVTEKLLATIAEIKTPYVVTAPDDDITLPHAINTSLAHLENNPDCVAAHGYVLRFGLQEHDVDIHSVFSFVPAIGQGEALQRVYHLIRRYQPFIWAVFRTEVFAEAMQAANDVDGFVFQELTFHVTTVLRGKVARLPVIFSMRGMEKSMSSLDRTHPLFWFLGDAELFFSKYTAYRNNLVRRIRAELLTGKSVWSRVCSWRWALRSAIKAISRRDRHGAPMLLRIFRNRSLAFPDGADLQQVLDLIHATWLGNEINLGMANYTVQRLLGDPIPPITIPPEWPGHREPAEGDLVHLSASGARRYVWRRAVLTAEPKEEITITAEEITKVERELDAYQLD